MLYTTHNFFNNETMESTKPQNIPGFCTLIMGTQSQLGANFTPSMILDKMCWVFFCHLFLVLSSANLIAFIQLFYYAKLSKKV